ncbi:hypothetical protein V5O48_005192 [Marasmius crinis-equi]|uniref:F-box domain-containing protein n=1 Tax=Marasmius crinis-equi TaxID=585013 RepID=A0ABR3FMZ3_9AGAR
MLELCERCKLKFTPKSQYPPVPNDKLSSFRAPLVGHELEDCLRAISEEEEDLASYNSEIVHYETILQRLKQERDTLEERIQNRRNVVSALRRIPSELLGEIFNYCVGLDPTAALTMMGEPTLSRQEQEEEWWSVFEAPFNLSQISSRWREIVLDTPELWSTI